MRSASSIPFFILLGMLLFAHGIYWFISGRGVGASTGRTTAVAAQVAVGLVLALWAWKQGRRMTNTPSSSPDTT